MYHEAKNAPEEKAWGTILADVARHVAHALETEYSANGARVLAMIRESFLDELDAPTSEAEGSFVRKH
jgi:hypothetical protein